MCFNVFAGSLTVRSFIDLTFLRPNLKRQKLGSYANEMGVMRPCHLETIQPVMLISRHHFYNLFWPLKQFSLGVFSMVGSYTVNIVGGVVQRLPSTGNNKDHDSGPQVGTVSIYTISLREKITLS